MKTKSIRKSISVCMFVCIICLAAVTNPLKAQTSTPGYYYDHGREVVLKPTQTICKLDDSGKYLVPHLKYFFTYDENERVKTKEAYRWDIGSQSWTESFRMNYIYTDGFTTIDYAEWNMENKTYSLKMEKAVYTLHDGIVVSYAYFKRSATDKDWQLLTSLYELQLYPYLIGYGHLLAGN
ncbi:MAG: DUF3836 domain-containing protein [Tannerella sp.]|jgi:hypothetical protein|nr:DUF3836 domain-containing protein [Tannerella sp.]